MRKREFSAIRKNLGKTQNEIARLLAVSPKAVQSFEQGWRPIPAHIQRQVLFLLAKKRYLGKRNKPCWVIKRCSLETRRHCPAWEFHIGELCWFINGTICQDKVQESWLKKMKICRECKVFRPILAAL